MKRAALYLRVSTTDQTTANQQRELREVAVRIGCEIVKVYRDHGISGATERGGEPVTTRREDVAAVLLDRGSQDRVVLFQRDAHLLRTLLPQTRGALDLREQDRLGSRRRLELG